MPKNKGSISKSSSTKTKHKHEQKRRRSNSKTELSSPYKFPRQNQTHFQITKMVLQNIEAVDEQVQIKQEDEKLYK